MSNHPARMRNPGTAAVLSALVPGIGQIYNGTFWRGLFWLIITPGLGWGPVVFLVGFSISLQPSLPTITHTNIRTTKELV